MTLLCIESRESEENAFLLCSLQRVLTLPSVAPCLSHKHLSIQIENRDGFYYQQNGRQHKTGFGTSSTTTAAFVCCLLLASRSIGWGLLGRTDRVEHRSLRRIARWWRLSPSKHTTRRSTARALATTSSPACTGAAYSLWLTPGSRTLPSHYRRVLPSCSARAAASRRARPCW